MKLRQSKNNFDRKWRKKNIVIDIDVNITLKNKNFIRRQKSNVVVRKIIFFIIVRDFDTTQHENSRYVILFIYFIDTRNNAFVKTFIKRKIHLIKDFKVNMLINNNIIVSKNILVNFTNQITNIRNCDVDMSLKIRFKIAHVQQRFVYVKKIIVLSSRIQLIVIIHDFFDNLSFDYNFFFESNDIELILYVYFVDFFTKIILITNNIDQSIKISRNFWLNKLVKLDYFHAFQIQKKNVVELITRILTREHKFLWFKKIISIFVVVAIVVVAIVVVNVTFNVTSSTFIVLIAAIVSFVFDFQIIVFQILISSTLIIITSNVFSPIMIKKLFANSISNLIMSNNVIIH